MRCCVSCFSDEYLRELIRKNGDVRNCNYCGATRRYTLPVGQLQELFERFLHLYEPVQEGQNVMPGDYLRGQPLADLIQDEWGIFSERISDDARSRLLSHIYSAGLRNEEILDAPAVDDLYTNKNGMYHHTLLDKWEELAEELKHPEKKPVINLPPPPEGERELIVDELDWFEEDIARAIIVLPKGSTMFRVRLGCDGEDGEYTPYPVTQMGAPPREKVERPGRANETGTSYLYVSEEEETAVAETRPHRGMLVTVAEGKTICDLRIVDLAGGMAIDSPFHVGEEWLGGLVESCELFNVLNDQYAEPLRRTDDTHEYIPTQWFANWCKRHGYDGIRYTSAMSEAGINLVLWDVSAVQFETSRLVQIEDVAVSYKKLNMTKGVAVL